MSLGQISGRDVHAPFKATMEVLSVDEATTLTPTDTHVEVAVPAASTGNYAITLANPATCIGSVVRIGVGSVAAGWSNGAVTMSIGDTTYTLNAAGEFVVAMSTGCEWILLKDGTA